MTQKGLILSFHLISSQQYCGEGFWTAKLPIGHIFTLQAVTHMYEVKKAQMTYFGISLIFGFHVIRQVITDTTVPSPRESDRKRSKYSQKTPALTRFCMVTAHMYKNVQ